WWEEGGGPGGGGQWGGGGWGGGWGGWRKGGRGKGIREELAIVRPPRYNLWICPCLCCIALCLRLNCEGSHLCVYGSNGAARRKDVPFGGLESPQFKCWGLRAP